MPFNWFSLTETAKITPVIQELVQLLAPGQACKEDALTDSQAATVACWAALGDWDGLSGTEWALCVGLAVGLKF